VGASRECRDASAALGGGDSVSEYKSFFQSVLEWFLWSPNRSLVGRSGLHDASRAVSCLPVSGSFGVGGRGEWDAVVGRNLEVVGAVWPMKNVAAAIADHRARRG